MFLDGRYPSDCVEGKGTKETLVSAVELARYGSWFVIFENEEFWGSVLIGV